MASRSTSILVIGWLFLLFYFYKFLSSPYIRHYVPEDTIMLGTHSSVNFDKSYWLLDSNTVASIPLYVRPNRLISLYIEFDHSPFQMEYKYGNELHKLSVIHNKYTGLHNVIAEEHATDSFQLSSLANQDEERIIPFRFRVFTPVKIYSYEVHRIAIPRIQLIMMILLTFLSGVATILIIYLIYLNSKKH